MFGDSITNGEFSEPWYTTAGTTLGSHVTMTNKGNPSFRVVDLQGVVAAQVVAWAPKVCVIQAGVNDVARGTDLTTFAASVATLISTIKEGVPGIRMGWMGILCYGEQIPDPNGPKIVALNAAIKAACSAAGIAYFDARTPQQQYEKANNKDDVSVGLVTIRSPPGPDPYYGVHPSVAVGVPLMSAAFLQGCALNW